MKAKRLMNPTMSMGMNETGESSILKKITKKWIFFPDRLTQTFSF